MMAVRWSPEHFLQTQLDNTMTIDNFTSHRIVEEARSWIGTPYIHQASKKGAGCDCLGLVRGIWRELLGEEPEITPAYSASWAEAGGKEQLLHAARTHFDPIERRNLSPGDLLLFRLRAKSPAKHLGIFTDTNHFIHAYDGASVVESALSEFWYRRLHSTYRFPGASN
jgi:NlpC/P60 family putative phage cell wall peptidase